MSNAKNLEAAWELLDDHGPRLVELEEAIGPRKRGEEHLPPLRERVELLETRSKSVQSAELAYRQATSTIEQLKADFADANAKTLNSAKAILEGSVDAALAPVTPVLDDLKEINEAQSVIIKEVRDEQKERAGREKQKAEDAAEDAKEVAKLAEAEAKAETRRKDRREFYIRLAAASAAILTPICAALGAYFAMKGH